MAEATPPSPQQATAFDRTFNLVNSIALFVRPFERSTRLEAAELLKQLCLAPDSEMVRDDVLQALHDIQRSGNAAAAA